MALRNIIKPKKARANQSLLPRPKPQKDSVRSVRKPLRFNLVKKDGVCVAKTNRDGRCTNKCIPGGRFLQAAHEKPSQQGCHVCADGRHEASFGPGQIELGSFQVTRGQRDGAGMSRVFGIERSRSKATEEIPGRNQSCTCPIPPLSCGHGRRRF